MPNGGITSIDIFGHADRVEAVEMWFTPMVHPTALLVVESLVATIIPGEQVESTLWFRDSLELIEQRGGQKQQTSVGDMYLTLQWVENLKQYFFSIDVEKQ